MGSRNRFGLSRNIPEEIKRKIRQNSKFGCVIPDCRNAFYEYEHILPEFKDAREHNPELICLVCSNHNPRKRNGRGSENYSKQQIQQYYDLIKNNTVVPNPVHKDFFKGFNNDPKVLLGKSTFCSFKSIINIEGENVFSFQRSQDISSFAPQIVFTGKFKDSDGNLLFELRNNEWISPTSHWDVVTKNGEIEIWDRMKVKAFHARKNPDKNEIEILCLDMWFFPYHLKLEGGEFSIGRMSKDKKDYIYVHLDAQFTGGDCAIYLDSREISPSLIWSGFSTVEGVGIEVTNNGIFLGRGAATCMFRSISVIHSQGIAKGNQHIYKKKVLPEGAHYFVTGELVTIEEQFPNWKEQRFFLNGQRLRSPAYSWGRINHTENLYYICSDEPEDLTQNSGFIGFYANDILDQEWADKVFECEVMDYDEYGNESYLRVKRYDINGRKIISEYDNQTNQYYYPHAFAGCSPWKS